MRKHIILLYLIILSASCFAQTVTKTVGIVYTAGAPAHAPAAKVGSQVAIDTVTWEWYEYNGSAWIASGDRIQSISGCSAPNYTPTKYQSRLVINSCTVLQNGHGPELYNYTGGEWLCLNCSTGTNISAGSGISIAGTPPDITISADDNSPTNELQTLSVSTNTTTLSNSGGSMTIAGGGINTVGTAGTTITITGTEVDGSISNEGSLTVGAGSGTTSIINSNTSGSTGVTLTAGTGLSISETGNVITLTNTSPDQTVSLTGAGITNVTGTYPNFTITSTEVDGSTTNELQTLSIDGNELTLSDGGGTVPLPGGGGAVIVDNYRLPGTNAKIPATGLNANESVTNYNFAAINPNRYKFSTSPYGTGSTDYGGWLANGTSGDSVAVSAPFWVVIGDSQAEGYPGRHGRLHSDGIGTVNLALADQPGQLSYTLARLTNMRWYNHGIGGETTTQVWARWRRDVLAETFNPSDGKGSKTLQRKPSGVVIVVGINDFFGGASQVAVASGNLLRMARSARDNGMQCVFLNCPGQEIATALQVRQIDSLNTFFASGALQALGAAVVDYNTWWRDANYNDNIHGSALITDDIHPSLDGYDSLAVYVFNAAKLPVLDSVTVYSEISPAGFSGFSRPTGITIQGRDYALSGASSTVPIIVQRFLHDSVWFKITASTNISGTSYSGFSHVVWHVRNDTAGLATRRPETYQGYQAGGMEITGSGGAGQFAYFTGDGYFNNQTVSSSGLFRFKGNNNIFLFTGIGADPLTTGQNNNNFGNGAGLVMTTASNNNNFGNGAGISMTTGSNNNNFGELAGDAITTGGGNNNFGGGAGGSLISGSSNNNFGVRAGAAGVAVFGANNFGYEAGLNSTADFAINIGYQAGLGNTSGKNVNIGTQAGNTTTTGTNNIMIGRTAQASSASASNELNFGNILYGTGINTARASGLTGGRIGIGTGAPVASSKLEVSSTTSGFLPPRMTSTQRDAISSPATGLTLYCTDCTATDSSTGVQQVYNGSTWKNAW